jgi:hypothetical protein
LDSAQVALDFPRSTLVEGCFFIWKRPRVRGGRLLTGKVRPTLEVTITETAPSFVRKKRADLESRRSIFELVYRADQGWRVRKRQLTLIKGRSRGL